MQSFVLYHSDYYRNFCVCVTSRGKYFSNKKIRITPSPFPFSTLHQISIELLFMAGKKFFLRLSTVDFCLSRISLEKRKKHHELLITRSLSLYPSLFGSCHSPSSVFAFYFSIIKSETKTIFRLSASIEKETKEKKSTNNDRSKKKRSETGKINPPEK